MCAIVCGFLIVMRVDSAQAQEPNGLLVQNPLVAICDALASVFDEAALPFTEAQIQQVALVMDEQRRPTEDFFGQVFNFSGGSPKGAQRGRDRSSLVRQPTRPAHGRAVARPCVAWTHEGG
jgi:hypothetical protein